MARYKNSDPGFELEERFNPKEISGYWTELDNRFEKHHDKLIYGIGVFDFTPWTVEYLKSADFGLSWPDTKILTPDLSSRKGLI